VIALADSSVEKTFVLRVPHRFPALVRFLTEKLTVVVLCNRTDLNAMKLALQTADAMR
jgi:hypothetical protein